MPPINGIEAFFDEAMTQAVPTNAGGTAWVIDKGSIYETGASNPNTTVIYFKNTLPVAIPEPFAIITRDDFFAIFGEYVAFVSCGANGPAYEVSMGASHEPNTLIAVTISLNIPRSQQEQNDVVVGFAYHNITYAPDKPKHPSQV